MAESQQAQAGAWPWGKGKETHQEQPKVEEKAGSAHDDVQSRTNKSAKDVPRSSESQVPIKLKENDGGDEKSEHYTTEPAKSVAPSKTTDHQTNGGYTNGVNGKDESVAPSAAQESTKSAKDDAPEISEEPEQLKDADKDAHSKAPTTQDATDEVKSKADDAAAPADDAKDAVDDAKPSEDVDVQADDEKSAKEDDAQNPLDELKSGLKAGDDDQAAPDTEQLKEVEPEPLSDEQKEKLTPGGGLNDKPLDDNISSEEVKPDDSISRVEEVEKDAKSEVQPEKAASDLKDDAKSTQEDATKEGDDVVKEGDDLPKDGDETAKPETEDLAKEGENVTKEGDDLPKDGEDVVEKGEDAAKPEAEDLTKEGESLTKEGDDAANPEVEAEDLKKDGEDVTKEGEDAAKFEGDDVIKEGETLTNEGEDALKEGEDALKEGEEATKDTTDEATEETPEIDFSILRNGKINKGGNVINEDGKVVGRVTEGIIAQLVGKRVDENGDVWNDSGKRVGKAEPIPDDEREGLSKASGPFEAFPDATVDGEGYVVANGERVGKVKEGDVKQLRGMSVDPDGDILDRSGNVVGKAERWEPEAEPEPEPEQEVDRSILAGKRVNKAGNVVDSSGTIYGRVVEGDPKRMVGRMCDKKGNILSESGDVIGRAEVVPEGEREGLKEGPFAELSGCTVTKDGKVVTPGGDVVGRLVSGDPKVLFGRLVDEDGDVNDKNGNVLGKAERWSEPEVEKKKGPMAGRRVNREGNVVDEDGNVIGKLTTGELSICAGKEIDDDGDVVDGKGTTVGHCSLLADIPAPKEEGETAEEKEKREKAEQDKKLAQQMAYCLTQCLDKVKPICSMITSKIEKAERTPKEELDEEELVKEVRPLIEEGGKILTESNGIIRGLDPDGRIQANAKHKAATHEATPEEHHLAEVLKELTGTVTQCIDNAKKKIEGMPHAKKELSPLWGLLSEPLFQILAAVGLLLNGVLGLVGRLLSGLGLGGIVDSLLGGLGVKNILQALGVGSLTDSLTGKNQKGGKKSGGLLGLG